MDLDLDPEDHPEDYQEEIMQVEDHLEEITEV